MSLLLASVHLSDWEATLIKVVLVMVAVPTGLENPVPTASTNTRSVLSSRLYWFGITW